MRIWWTALPCTDLAVLDQDLVTLWRREGFTSQVLGRDLGTEQETSIGSFDNTILTSFKRSPVVSGHLEQDEQRSIP